MSVVYVICDKNDIVTNGYDCNNWDICEPKLHNHNTWDPKSYKRDTMRTKIEQLEPGVQNCKVVVLDRPKM